jgi:hypothetical protein
VTHDELVEALRSLSGLRDIGKSHPNFHFKSRPFLHFHVDSSGRTFADVRLGSGDFEEVWASTPGERAELFALVADHVERTDAARKPGRGRARRP